LILGTVRQDLNTSAVLQIMFLIAFVL